MRKIVFLFALIFASNSMFAETALDVLENCSKAMKSEKRADFKTIKQVIVNKAMGQEFTTTLYRKDGTKFRLEVKSPMGEQVIIKNENDCAIIKPVVQDLPAEQWDQVLSQIKSQDVDIRQYIEEAADFTLELKGVEEFNGKSCKLIEMKPKEAIEDFISMTLCIDALTNWLVGYKIKISEGDIEMLFSDMKKVKGVIYPGVITTKFNGTESSTTTIESFEVNLDLDDNLFNKP
ncbi:MAG: outer membrane lipoprotein-sorting protein [Ignavibacteria bacterium]|jgi:outer membrane lipoprotein-sorting protein|nr:outer membrane lipoprotein-sorting protein [Ignavibacteria bacterium]